MDKRVVNAKEILRPDTGEPYQIKLKEGDPEHPGCLAEFIIIAINSIPAHNLTISSDGYKAIDALRVCHVYKDKEVLPFEEGTYDWVMKSLFDDAEGPRLSRQPNGQSLYQGAIAINTMGFLAVQLKRAMEVFGDAANNGKGDTANLEATEEVHAL